MSEQQEIKPSFAKESRPSESLIRSQILAKWILLLTLTSTALLLACNSPAPQEPIRIVRYKEPAIESLFYHPEIEKQLGTFPWVSSFLTIEGSAKDLAPDEYVWVFVIDGEAVDKRPFLRRDTIIFNPQAGPAQRKGDKWIQNNVNFSGGEDREYLISAAKVRDPGNQYLSNYRQRWTGLENWPGLTHSELAEAGVEFIGQDLIVIYHEQP